MRAPENKIGPLAEILGIKTGTLEACIISANMTEGFTVTTADGRPARLAVIDEDGNVIEQGPVVAAEAWSVCLQVQHNFWKGMGHLKVSSPEEIARRNAA